jgi:copper(I)-binding protein
MIFNERRGFGISGTMLLGLMLFANASAEGIADKITVNDPYVRAVPPVVKTSAAFM